MDYQAKKLLVSRIEKLVRDGVPVTKAAFLAGTTYNSYKRAKRYLANPKKPKYRRFASDRELLDEVSAWFGVTGTVQEACQKAGTYPGAYYSAKRRLKGYITG